MAISVYKFPQPYLELELVAGGTLPVADYYFLGWFQRHGGYYHTAHGPCSEEQMITTTSGNQSIKVTWWQGHGDITSFADSMGYLQVNSTAHGLQTDDMVTIKGTTNYDGVYEIVANGDDFFIVDESYVGTETGEWFYENSIPSYVTEGYTGSSGICFKWDNYSMINSATSKPYKWLNMNDPSNTGSEWDTTYGHRKWTQAYSVVTYRTGGSNTFTALSTAVGGLKDGVNNGTSYASRGSGNIQLAMKDSDVTYGVPLDSSWGDIDSKLQITIDDTDTNNNWDDLITALDASGYDDYYRKYIRSGVCVGLDLIGNYDGDGVGTWTNVSLHSSGGWRGKGLTYDNCQITWLPTQYQCRTSGDYCVFGTFKNTSMFYAGTSFDLYDSYMTTSNFSPYGQMTFYLNCEGITFNSGSGGYLSGYSSYQFRYPNAATPHYMKDVTANGMYASITYAGSNTIKDISVTDYNANNYELVPYDFSISYSYTDGDVCEFNWNCVNLASNRPDGKIINYYSSLGDPASYDETWYSRYNIELNVVDVDGNGIEGAYVTLIGDETDDDYTTGGEATVTMLGYTVSPPTSGTSGYSTSSDWKTADLTITKAGMGTYKLKNIEIREGKKWTVVLPASGTETKIYDSTLYDSTIY